MSSQIISSSSPGPELDELKLLQAQLKVDLIGSRAYKSCGHASTSNKLGLALEDIYGAGPHNSNTKPTNQTTHHDPVTPRKPTVSTPNILPTPSPTPPRGKKRSRHSAFTATSDSNPSKTRCLLIDSSATTSDKGLPVSLDSSQPIFHTTRAPKFSIAHPPSDKISWLELKRAAESILGQVDWHIVAEDVASNRRGPIYKKMIKEVLQEKLDKLSEGN